MMWGEAITVLKSYAKSKNGSVTTSSGGEVPALTRQQAASIILGGVRVAARSKLAWPIWYDVALPTLGHYEDADRFQMSSAFQASKLDAATSEVLWGAMAQLVADLDRSGVPFSQADFVPSATRYDQLAKMAWGRMKAERGDDAAAAAIPIPLVPKPIRDIGKEPTPTPTPSKSAIGWGLAILAGLYLLSDNGSKRRRR
jgi:hypothetical protein